MCLHLLQAVEGWPVRCQPIRQRGWQVFATRVKNRAGGNGCVVDLDLGHRPPSLGAGPLWVYRTAWGGIGQVFF